ncbi:hypothetical protein ABBQ32_007303 [Trebouxia sp. C0010 RCD-2024]
MYTYKVAPAVVTGCGFVQTKALVSSPVFYAAGTLLYLASLVLWGGEGLLGTLWQACGRYFADGQALHLPT